MSDAPRIPESASAPPTAPVPVPDAQEAIVLNPSAGQELLTPEQAIDLINYISGVLLAHERNKRHPPSVEENQDHL